MGIIKAYLGYEIVFELETDKWLDEEFVSELVCMNIDDEWDYIEYTMNITN